ncbi:Hypothetical protein A7982_05861 [Minicystis rosea]|nr:Hypothetical protein A7982_05861 [Minicystis rosea]
MSGTVCEAVGAENYCVGNDTGRACTMANACNFACLNSQYCTVQCNSGADCPNGFGCMEISNTRVCVKAAEYCEMGNAAGCIAPAACDLSPDMYVGGCTLVCDTAADCPQRAAGFPPWTCDGLCRRPPDVFGPLEGGFTPALYVNDCQGKVVNVCNDGQHIDFNAFNIPSTPAATCGAINPSEGIATDSCLDSCRYQGSCAYGFSCVAVGGINNNQQRIGLCLPNGGGEVGAACQHDSQCVFGYCSNNKCSRDCTADGICPTGFSCVAAGGPAVEGAPFRRCQ